MLVITMTSWPERINYAKDTISSCLEQTILPDRIYLNLSKEEFETIELPKDLLKLIDSDSRIILNWIEGPNTKPFKKIFPILKYLEDDDFIINVDDDMVFPKGFIESRLLDFDKYHTCISGSAEKINGYASGLLPEFRNRVGPATLYQKKMLKHWEDLLNNDIIATNHDDAFYDFLIYLNGYLPQTSSKYHCMECTRHIYTPALHGSIGCANATQATIVNIETFKLLYDCFPCLNYYKTNKEISIGRPITELNPKVEYILKNTLKFTQKQPVIHKQINHDWW